MDQNLFRHNNSLISDTAKNLEKNHFSAIIAENNLDAKNKILNLINKGEKIAFGGSKTVKDLELIEAFQDRKQELMLQKPEMSRSEIIELRRNALLSDVYIASPNALTKDGFLIFVDKIGNRSSAMVFGPRKVIAVAGINKIVESETEAYNRVKFKAGPMNSKRLGLDKNPCTKTGVCSDCSSIDRICNVFVTVKKKPSYTEYYVVLIPQELGY
ncbi:lactate utilization protein [Elusimicrobiota bacterium]